MPPTKKSGVETAIGLAKGLVRGTRTRGLLRVAEHMAGAPRRKAEAAQKAKEQAFRAAKKKQSDAAKATAKTERIAAKTRKTVIGARRKKATLQAREANKKTRIHEKTRSVVNKARQKATAKAVKKQEQTAKVSAKTRNVVIKARRKKAAIQAKQSDQKAKVAAKTRKVVTQARRKAKVIGEKRRTKAAKNRVGSVQLKTRGASPAATTFSKKTGVGQKRRAELARQIKAKRNPQPKPKFTKKPDTSTKGAITRSRSVGEMKRRLNVQAVKAATRRVGGGGTKSRVETSKDVRALRKAKDVGRRAQKGIVRVEKAAKHAEARKMLTKKPGLLNTKR